MSIRLSPPDLFANRHDGSPAWMNWTCESRDHLAEALMRFGRLPVVLAGLSAPGKAYHFSWRGAGASIAKRLNSNRPDSAGLEHDLAAPAPALAIDPVEQRRAQPRHPPCQHR